MQAVDHAPQVDAEHPLPIGQGELDDVPPPPTPALLQSRSTRPNRRHVVGEGLDRCRIAHVGRDPGDPELGGGRLEGAGLHVGDHHGHALASQARRQRPADPAGPARDDGHPPR